MMGKPVDVLVEAIGMKALDGLYDARVQREAPFMEQAAVGHIVSESVLEGILMVGEGPRLVKELGPLEVGKTALQCGFRKFSNDFKQGRGHHRADGRRGL
jgi:hypothetical protein